MKTRVGTKAILATILGLSIDGCFAPEFLSGNLQCSSKQTCPEGMVCFADDNRCYFKDEVPSTGADLKRDDQASPDQSTADLAGADLVGFDASGVDEALPDQAGDDLAPEADLTPPVPVVEFSQKPTYDFGSIVANQASGNVNLEVKNVGASLSGALSAATLSGTNASNFTVATDGCSGQFLAPSQTCTITVSVLAPSAGSQAATLTIEATPGGLASIELKATAVAPGALSVSPSPGNFPMVLAGGAGSDLPFTVTNTGGAASGALSVMIDGNDKTEFSVGSGTCVGLSALEAGNNCSLNLHFAGSTGGMKSASLIVNASPGGPGIASLNATALSPATFAFSQAMYVAATPVEVGMNSVIELTLKNTGTQPTGSLPTFQTVGDSEFKVIAGGTCVSGSPLAGNGMCTVLVRFSPASYGAKADSVIVSASPGGTAMANLQATGQKTFTLTVTNSGATGTDKLTSSDGFINCGNGATACSHGYAVTSDPPPQPTITPMVGANSRFIDFTGDCTGATCVPTMNANHTNIVANWKATFVASVTVSGAAGAVTSTSTPTQATQFNCTTGTCQVTFDADMVVNVTAAPSGQNAFVSWTGPCASQTNELCQLDLTHKTATVAFAAPVDVATWTFAGSVNSTTGVTPTAVTNVTGGSLIVQGPGTPGGVWADAFCAYNGSLSATPDPAMYYQFSVTAVTGHSIAYRTAESVVRVAASSPTKLAKWSVRSNIDGYAADLATGEFSNNYPNSLPLNMDIASLGQRSGTVTFRLYLYNIANGTSGQLCLLGLAQGGTNLRVRGVVF